jgi:hypothetical protein
LPVIKVHQDAVSVNANYYRCQRQRRQIPLPVLTDSRYVGPAARPRVFPAIRCFIDATS